MSESTPGKTVTSCSMQTAAIHLTSVPSGSTSTIALAASGMGYSIPAAIGAQCGSPAGTQTTVICDDRHC
ncbi:hypothetical protein [Streptomyces sp. NBC_00233]|uniref:hypothetical protein n=1 Tax=Streptomyces sp. NBC_00233 TaxID=2975686 RepID=UPI002254F768|nr:hypothetical protein [Streptomyces sp. NBC_00233]MCX5233520.1 hypothetical protein [Streptomyces sp. NBC_00233]